MGDRTLIGIRFNVDPRGDSRLCDFREPVVQSPCAALRSKYDKSSATRAGVTGTDMRTIPHNLLTETERVRDTNSNQ